MAPYKFDWTATISGTIEIDAENGIEASELFKTLNNQELVEQSEIMLARSWREVRFEELLGLCLHTLVLKQLLHPVWMQKSCRPQC